MKEFFLYIEYFIQQERTKKLITPKVVIQEIDRDAENFFGLWLWKGIKKEQ